MRNHSDEAVVITGRAGSIKRDPSNGPYGCVYVVDQISRANRTSRFEVGQGSDLGEPGVSTPAFKRPLKARALARVQPAAS